MLGVAKAIRNTQGHPFDGASPPISHAGPILHVYPDQLRKLRTLRRPPVLSEEELRKQLAREQAAGS